MIRWLKSLFSTRDNQGLYNPGLQALRDSYKWAAVCDTWAAEACRKEGWR